MAITIIQYPAGHTDDIVEAINPAYNPIVFTVDSTNKSQCSMQYICYVYVNGVFATRLKDFPKGANGYGTFKVENVLSDFLTYDLQENLYGSTLFSKNPNSFLRYELKFGEEYDSSAQCDVGTTIYPNLLSSNTVTAFTAFNGALQKKEWLDYDSIFYNAGNYYDALGSINRFLTDFPQEGLICYGDQMVWNIFIDNLTTPYLEVKTYNDSNALISTYQSNCTLSLPVVDLVSVGVGPENLNNTTLDLGTQPVINSVVKYYTVQLFKAGPVPATKLFQIN